MKDLELEIWFISKKLSSVIWQFDQQVYIISMKTSSQKKLEKKMTFWSKKMSPIDSEWWNLICVLRDYEKIIQEIIKKCKLNSPPDSWAVMGRRPRWKENSEIVCFVVSYCTLFLVITGNYW